MSNKTVAETVTSEQAARDSCKYWIVNLLESEQKFIYKLLCCTIRMCHMFINKNVRCIQI